MQIHGSWHVVPTEDSKPHTTITDFCKCEPRIETQPNGIKVVVHNAWDGREFYEQEKDECILKKK